MINIRNCVFGFKCTADWDAMKATSDETIRHCAGCKKDVYQVSTKEELFDAIQLNRCVAIFDKPNKPDFDGKMINNEDVGVILSMPTLGVPARYKRNKHLGAENTNINDYDIPAFLRKPDDKK
jgi:hypothetical protein